MEGRSWGDLEVLLDCKEPGYGLDLEQRQCAMLEKGTDLRFEFGF